MSLKRYGTEVWNGGMDRIPQKVWNEGMERGYGLRVVPGPVPDIII
jgi:hypothetical protein